MGNENLPGRGCANVILIAMFLWIVIFAGAAVIVSLIAKAT